MRVLSRICLLNDTLIWKEVPDSGLSNHFIHWRELPYNYVDFHDLGKIFMFSNGRHFDIEIRV